MALSLLIGTQKGIFVLDGDSSRKSWKLRDTVSHFGNVVDDVKQDPRNAKLLLAAAKTGHLGPTVFRSFDGGATWKEASKPPAFPKVEEGKDQRTVSQVFCVHPGHPSTPHRWYAGTVPFGMFVSDDDGDTWEPVAGFNELVSRPEMDGATPAGPITHSILVDPRDAKHMYVCCSSGGFLETTDSGATWKHLNKGSVAEFLPDPNPEFGQDPHCAKYHPLDPDILWQQNHCGVYRMDRRKAEWERVGLNLPKEIGDIGFGIVVHPREIDTAWVFPMDGTSVWPRTSPGGAPAAYRTRDAGKSWERQDGGFPDRHGYFTVFRHAIRTDVETPLGLYLGTTNGEVWGSRDEGASWECLVSWLPRILSVEVAHDLPKTP